MLSNGLSEVAVGAAVSSPPFPDLMLGIHEAFLDPGAVFLVRADGFGVEELRQGSLDLLVDFI